MRGGHELGPRVLRTEDREVLQDREVRQDRSLHSDADMLGLCKMENWEAREFCWNMVFDQNSTVRLQGVTQEDDKEDTTYFHSARPLGQAESSVCRCVFK